MKLSTRRVAGLFTVAAMTTTLFSTAAFADSAAVNVNGTVNAGGTEIAVDLVSAADSEAGAQSVSGKISISGMDLNFAEYMDGEKIMLQIPLVPAVLSYNYAAAAGEGFLAEQVGAETLDGINGMIAAYYDTLFNADVDCYEDYASDIVAAISNTVGACPMEQCSKECTVGDELVECAGLKTTVDGETAAALYDQILAISNDEGVTIADKLAKVAEMYDMLGAISSESQIQDLGSMVDQLLNAHDMVASMPNVDIAAYMNESGMPAEIDATINGSTLEVKLQGDAATPWTVITIGADGTEHIEIDTEYTGSAIAMNLYNEGELVGGFQAGVEGTAAELTIFEGTDPVIMASADLEAMTWEASAAGMLVYGDILDNGFTANMDGLFNFTVTVDNSAAVAVPEGDVIDITTATEEDLNTIISSVSSLLGAA